jgi:chromate transporter
MGKDSISDWRTIVIAIISLTVVFGFKKINSALVVMGGAGLGYLLNLI